MILVTVGGVVNDPSNSSHQSGV